MIFTGPSFTHGEVDKERESFADLEAFARDHFGVAGRLSLDQRGLWLDRPCPYVGWSSSLGDCYLVATGFNAWGITNGTAAAILIADLIQDRENPWLKVFDATRIKPIAGREEVRRGQCGDGLASGRRLSGAQAAQLRRARARRGGDPQDRRPQCRRLSRRAGRAPRGLGGLHPYGLRGRLERDRPELGLPLPRLALRARRQRHPRPGGEGAGSGRRESAGGSRMKPPAL